MAPYDFNLTDDWNPVGEWDWWVIDSRTGSAYLAPPEHDGDSRLGTACTVPTGTADLAPLGPLECCGGPRGPARLRRRDGYREQGNSCLDDLRGDAVIVSVLCHC